MAVKKYRAKKIISKLLFGILVLVIVIPILFPLYFVLISSFKNMAQVYIMPPKLFGFKPILDNYIYIFKTQHYGTYMMNSTIVAVASTALSLLLGVPAAYAIARYKMGKSFPPGSFLQAKFHIYFPIVACFQANDIHIVFP